MSICLLYTSLADEGGEIDIGRKNDIFIFEYGVVVMWGYSTKEEAAFLEDLAKFESEKLSSEDIQIEEFNYYITKSYQPRIYNDFITLRDDNNYMLKLSISHALAQSVKISLFEELVDNTIEDTQDIPQQIAHTGKVAMTRDEIMKSIGELFILRININSVSYTHLDVYKRQIVDCEPTARFESSSRKILSSSKF